jgi:hypothetical protein
VVKIKLSYFLKTYNLHDSVVESLTFNEVEEKLSIELELCQWKQSFYQDREPEMRLGILTFSGVTLFQIKPNSFSINSNEILDANLLSADSKSESIKIVLDGDEDVIIILIQAKGVEWE